MAVPGKLRYKKPINTCFFKIIYRLFVTFLLFIYFLYFYRTFNISRMIYTDIR